MEDKTILIVDDTVTNLDILIELLDEYDVIDATNGEDALDIADEEHIDLILLDIMMPNMDGFEVCQKLKNNPKTKNIPIIFITAKTDEDSIEKAYDMGGADYVSKPFLPKELKARVKKELRLQDIINELKELASTDSMTRLYNRRYFTKASRHILDLAKRNHQETSIIMLDIDKFKNFNDTYGHDVGDKVIIALANKLIDTQRKSDLICRYGGEEFVILLSNTPIKGALSTAESIRKNMQDIRLEHGDSALHFTVSIGVSCMHKDEDSIQKALKRADEALYEAKHSGRNRVCSQV